MSDLPKINIKRQPDGSWTAHPQPPLPATTTFITDGWSQVVRLRSRLGAVDHFETDEYPHFVAQFGDPPAH